MIAIVARTTLGSWIVANSFDRLANQFLDRAKFAAFGGRAERNRDALGTGAARSANSMYVAFRFDRHIVIDDMRDTIDIDAASGDVGCNQHLNIATTEGIKCRCRAFCDLLPWIAAALNPLRVSFSAT